MIASSRGENNNDGPSSGLRTGTGLYSDGGSSSSNACSAYSSSLARFSGPEALDQTPSLADFITTTSGFRFSVHTGVSLLG